ncbi:formylglycine-generating enzyme required for sulfatase activity [Roseomonas alkaliterrae]|uniref:Formylglycine-generating enzyme required for sulfatase activity n=2 Tax=Neoroseomonas alkaliterrae TaxID=1452450 RepID=A0A840XX91_9PROT|nr:SUMF1/EgtB/PvdO family nonheme iron enzyme [Neoroseomonas alkaliterrae]MBB5691229.1 formylglycine-generating enzyme required for sulfatase activity [Neoroseomonas alkaliterrae]
MRAAFAALLLLAAPAAAEAPWPQDFINPRPAEGDLLLPMPCGGAMAFRPVETPAGPGALDDRPVTIGTTDPAGGAAEFARREAVAGPFAREGRDVALFWIGKYEVTRDQYAAVMEERCPAPSAEGRLPAASLSWFDAVAFGQRYTTWLLRNARARVPQADGVPAFIRLPTEEEWEYAARGGAAVSELDFLGRTFPMPEGTARHAWFQGPRSAAGRAQPVGMLEPNPLGLHDVLGNVGEMVLEPFRAVRVGRRHGQAGGVVVKGGDFRTPEAALRSSLRIEIPPYDPTDGQPTRLPTVGFRVVLAAHVTTSLRRAEALNRAFEAESRASGTEAENARRQIAALREGADARLRQGLDRLEAQLMAAERQRLEQERAGLRAQLEGAAVLARSAVLSQRRLDGFQALLDGADVVQASPEMRANWARAAEGLRVERELALDGYGRIVADLGRSADRATLTTEAGVVARETEARGVPDLRPFLDIAARHAADSRDRGLPARDRMREEVIAAGRAMAPPAQAAAPPARQPEPAPAARPPQAAPPARPAPPPVAALPPPPPAPPVTAEPEPPAASRPSQSSQSPRSSPPAQRSPPLGTPGISVKPPIQRSAPAERWDPFGPPPGLR